MEQPMDTHRSLPTMGRSGSQGSGDDHRLYSFSLTQLRRHSEIADFHHKPSPFNIRWVYGLNEKVGVINLNDYGTTTLFYAACNNGVLYNWTTNQMRILQGHKHVLTCIASDKQGKWLVTADSGPENIITVWDSTDYFPSRTIFSPHGSLKLAKVAISSDAKYLLTLAYKETACISWWIWSFPQDEAHATVDVDISHDGVVAMSFNPKISEQFVLMTKTDIWIGSVGKIFVMERGLWKETDNYKITIRKPERCYNQDYGKLTCFTFVEDTCQILVGTSRGGVLVYGYTIEYQENVDGTNIEALKFIKPLKIDKYKINVITNVDGTIVTGNSGGEVRFYDNQMKLLYWVHGFTVDSVKCLCFNVSSRSYQIFDAKCKKYCPCWEQVVPVVDSVTGLMRQKLLKHKIPSDSTTNNKSFLVRDFIVMTANQGIGFVDFVTEKLVTILDCNVSPATALTVHPEKPLLCVGYANGRVELVNFIQHKLFARIDLRVHFKIVIPPKEDSIKGDYEVITPNVSVTCLKYSPSGLHLACGLNTGELVFLDPTTIEIVTKIPFRDTSYAIKEFNYSCDSLTLAFADVGNTVGVYTYDCDDFVWKFIGKHRSHYQDISTIFFTPEKSGSGNYYNLISIGQDRIMVEYDLDHSNEEFLEILSLDRIDQTAVPLTAIPWPTPKELDPHIHRMNLPLILVACDEYKYKLVNYSTTMTLNTVLGPRYETPVCKMQLVNKREGDKDLQYLVFATKNVIGMQKMPLDGNPWKHAGLLAHPTQITEMCFREDLGILFTIGAKDSCVCQWAANYRSIEKTTAQGGTNLDPYYCLIEDGRPGWLFQEIRDLFYYIQILCQGTFTPVMRTVKDYIPIESLPDLMRALGYFPSEYEVENILVAAKYKVYQRCASTEIDFEEFVHLYLNHRPAFGDSMLKIKSAFRAFATVYKDNFILPRQEFLELLSNYGECFSKEQSWYLLSILSGQSSEDCDNSTEVDFSFLPENITFFDLVSTIMGVQDVESTEQSSLVSSSQLASDISSQSNSFS